MSWLPILGILVAAVVLLILLVVLIGSRMRERFEGSTTVHFEASIDAVWEALQDPEAHPMTGRMMKSVERLPDQNGLPAWKEDMGRGEIITVTTTHSEAPRAMTRQMSASAVNMDSTWTYELEADASKCTVKLSGITDIKSGTWHTPIFRVMMVIGGGVKKGLDIQLGMVGATLGATADGSA